MQLRPILDTLYKIQYKSVKPFTKKDKRTHSQKPNERQYKSAIQQRRKIIIPLQGHLGKPLLYELASDPLILHIKPPIDILDRNRQRSIAQCPRSNETRTESLIVVVHRWFFRSRVFLQFR